jgi:tetratricopeptide (TPR) repeat protein
MPFRTGERCKEDILVSPSMAESSDAESRNAAIGLDPKYEDAWLAKARLLQSLKRITEALQALDTAIELDPKNAGIWRRKSRYLIADQRYEDVLEAYERSSKWIQRAIEHGSVMGIFTGSNINMMKKPLQHSIRLQN